MMTNFAVWYVLVVAALMIPGVEDSWFHDDTETGRRGVGESCFYRYRRRCFRAMMWPRTDKAWLRAE